ncbi:phage major capsid protein [Sphingopyxis macrogoltabida]|uniref:Capsid protein n=1 Tax=Sphingopyxis macrogoltabida TaxID=33050 RepID=A0AAC8Z284_SPHMC|nr:phage major capsid protein [Sphingopyxis macrogoltabida]ALJ14259.1 capsid protein [Sphingopyxis macrogoltabida]AMU90524.1 capsid protein [Sphingopyxis macrogoltabida]
MAIKELTLKDAREKAQKLQDDLGKVFGEAKTDDGQHDFRKVTFFGDAVKGSIAVAEKVKQLDDELNETMVHVEKLEGAEKAAASFQNRLQPQRGFALPGAKGEKEAKGSRLIGSLGELVTGHKAFEAWQQNARSGGVTIQLDDIGAFDFLAAANGYETIGAKALMSTTAGFAPESPRLPGYVDAVTRPIELLDILPTSQTGSEAIKYMLETTRNHGAAEAAEGGAYGESEFVFTEKSSPVQKITDSVPVTDEQLADVPFMNSYLNGRLSFGCRQRLDRQAMIGDGNDPNLRGLKNTVGIQVQAKGGDPVPDVFFKMMTKIRVTGGAIPTHHIIHPTDWQGIRLLRTNDGIYIFGAPSESGPDRLWGLPVVQNSADVAGTGYTGSFQPAWVSLSERAGVVIEIGYVGTQFTEGKRTVRAQLRAALTFFRPAAFCQGTGL